MTTPTFADPAEGFLDPNPLVDNLPSTDLDAPPSHHHLAVGIGAAFLIWRTINAQKLIDNYMARKTIEHMILEKVFEQVAQPAYEDLFREQGHPDPKALAEVQAEIAGQYLEETSKEAVLKAYKAELARGVDPELAWERAASGFGLDDRQMKSWLAGQAANDKDYVGGVMSPSAEAALDRGLLQRADVFGQTEAWQARQTGQTLLWMHQEQTGNLPAGTMKKWITREDEKVCPACGPLHEQTVGLSERFELPGASVWAPGMHPNCRCQLILVLPTEGLLEKYVGQQVLTGPTPSTYEIKQSVPKPKRILRKLTIKQNTRIPGTLGPSVSKAVAGDMYDRDSAGRFAAVEERVEEETQVEPVVETDFNPFQAMREANPFAELRAKTAANPFTETSPLKVESPFEVFNPFAVQAPTAQKQGVHINLKFDKPAGPPPDPDRVPVLPADDFFRGVMESGASSAQLSSGGYNPGKNAGRSDLDDPRLPTGFYDPDDISLELGTTIDFDLLRDKSILGYTFSDSAASHDINRVLTDISWLYEPMWSQGTGFEGQEASVYGDYNDYSRASDLPYIDSVDDAIAARAREIEGNSYEWADELSAEDIHKMVNEVHGDVYYDMSTRQLRNMVADEASDTSSELGQKMLQWTLEAFPLGEMDEQQEFSGTGYYRTPKIFTFPNGHLGDWESGKDGATHPRIGGKYKVSRIKYHSLVGEDGHSLEGEPLAYRVKGWEEYQLVPLEETQ